MTPETIIALVIGLIFGGALVWLWMRNQVVGQMAALNEKLVGKDQAISERTLERDKTQNEIVKLRSDLAKETEDRSVAQTRAERVSGLESNCRVLTEENSVLKKQMGESAARFKEAEKGLTEKLTILQNAEEKLSATFKVLSSQVLEKSNESFLQLAKTTFEGYKSTTIADVEGKQKAINELLKPMKESLDKIEKERQTAYSGLTEQIKILMEESNDLRSETSRLVQALKTPTIRGRWGEIQLKRVVEFTGMIKYCDFDEQVSTTSEEGRLLRPDMIAKLPNGRSVVVDAKVPLQAFLEALESKDEAIYEAKMKSHAEQVKQHIDKLSKKEYWNQFEQMPEFVFAFIPAESIYSAALQEDPTLIEYGASKNVILATPTSLITLLRAIAHGWREVQLAESAKEISEQGKDLYDRLVTFVGHFASLRKAIDKTVETFNSSLSSMETRVLPSARKMNGLGIISSNVFETIGSIEKVTREAQIQELIEGGTAKPIK